MKKSPIFLGVTACALAIAGAFTTKANTKVLVITALTKDNCTELVHTDCLNSGSNVCKTTTNGVVTLRTKVNCIDTIKTAS